MQTASGRTLAKPNAPRALLQAPAATPVLITPAHKRLAWRAEQCIGVRPPRAADYSSHSAALLSIQPLLSSLLEARSGSSNHICLRLQQLEPPQDCLADAAAAACTAVACCAAAVCRAAAICCAGAPTAATIRCTATPAIRCCCCPLIRGQPACLLLALLPSGRLQCLLHALGGAAIKAEASMHQAIKVGGLWQAGWRGR